jgi:hypothetical protein
VAQCLRALRHVGFFRFAASSILWIESLYEGPSSFTLKNEWANVSRLGVS